MTIPQTQRALFVGAIGVLAETSELQRGAYNLAFTQSGLDWTWDPAFYRELLHDPGGVKRIAAQARRTGETVDAEAIHARKVANFRAAVLREGLTPRPGVIETLEAARDAGFCVGWVTTTGRQTVDLMLAGLGGAITEDTFDFILDREAVARPKPAPDAYTEALARAGVGADSALAVEDTPESAEAALGARIDTVGFPGWAAEGRVFPPGVRTVAALSPDILTASQTA